MTGSHSGALRVWQLGLRETSVQASAKVLKKNSASDDAQVRPQLARKPSFMQRYLGYRSSSSRSLNVASCVRVLKPSLALKLKSASPVRCLELLPYISDDLHKQSDIFAIPASGAIAATSRGDLCLWNLKNKSQKW